MWAAQPTPSVLLSLEQENDAERDTPLSAINVSHFPLKSGADAWLSPGRWDARGNWGLVAWFPGKLLKGSWPSWEDTFPKGRCDDRHPCSHLSLWGWKSCTGALPKTDRCPPQKDWRADWHTGPGPPTSGFPSGWERNTFLSCLSHSYLHKKLNNQIILTNRVWNTLIDARLSSLWRYIRDFNHLCLYLKYQLFLWQFMLKYICFKMKHITYNKHNISVIYNKEMIIMKKKMKF